MKESIRMTEDIDKRSKYVGVANPRIETAKEQNRLYQQLQWLMNVSFSFTGLKSAMLHLSNCQS